MIPLIGITLGDPAGIGPEIVLKALANEDVRRSLQPVIFGDRAVMEQAMAQTGLSMPIRSIASAHQLPSVQGLASAASANFTAHEAYTAEFSNFLPLVEAGSMLQLAEMGCVSGACGRAAFSYIRTAIEWALAGSVSALTTAPINKASLQQGEVPFIDHTEMLASLTKSPRPMTLFAVDNLRIFFLTKHIPLRRVAETLTLRSVVEGLVESDRGLQQLGLSRRRIALAALNPHASDDGLFGDEEKVVLEPAVEEVRQLGLEVFGPIPADSVFHQCSQGEYEAVLSLYHDQGHIAAKTLDFYRTVSFTLGLPFLRTTPDHGTAFAIAGKNIANPASLVEALLAAVKYGAPELAI